MPVAAQRPTRIGLIGGECTGKSALAEALASTLPACVVDEGLREFVELHGRGPWRSEQPAILADQQQREEVAARGCMHPWLVADPAPLMTAVYSRLYFDDDSLTQAAAELARGYALVVWCDIDVPWVADDAQRDGPAFRARAHDLVAALVHEDLEPRGIRVVRVSGSVADRVAAVGRAWQP